MVWRRQPGSNMPVSTLLEDALKARRINQVFGTNYDALALRKLDDSHIEEMLTFVGYLDGDMDKPRKDTGNQPEAF